MKKTGLIIVLGIFGFLILVGAIALMWGVGIHNTMVDKDEKAVSQWANVETAYQRRADLIPNLVNTVKGYAEFEQETLTKVIEARSKATSVNIDASNLSPQMIGQFQKAQEGLSGALSRLLVTIEKYPDLKADQRFAELQTELTNTENKIGFERKKFNDSVLDYNRYIKKIPKSIVASISGFVEKGYFQAVEGSETAPTVEF